MFSTTNHAFSQRTNKLCQKHKPPSSINIAILMTRFRQLQTANMFAKHSFATWPRNVCNSLNHKGRSCWQFYSQNYSVANLNHMKKTCLVPQRGKRSLTTIVGDRLLEENSHINTRNHIYYEKYSIPGFNPIVYNLSKQADPSMKISTMDVQKKDVVVEDICCPAACNAHCEKCSIVAFKSNNLVLGSIEVAKKDSATNIESGEEGSDDYVDPYDHTYYKNYSITGFNPIRTPSLTPAHPKLTKIPTNKTLNMSRAKALSIAAAYVPSVCVPRKINQKGSDIDHGIDTCARTIESLEWETLGIIGLRDASHDLEEEEEEYEGGMEVEKEKDN